MTPLRIKTGRKKSLLRSLVIETTMLSGREMAMRSLLGVAFLLLATSPFFSAWISSSQAEDEEEHAHQAQSGENSLADQIDSLRMQVSDLELRVRTQGVDSAAMKANGDNYRSQMKMGNLVNAQQVPVAPAAAPAGGNQMGGMNMMAGMMGMMNSMMGGMSGGSGMSPPPGMGSAGILSVLPGFPGASHLYHVGSTNFFLDHPEHLALSLEQQNRLGQLQTQATLRRSELSRKIQEGEEQLWLLTAVDQPSLTQIESKIREIEKLRGDERLAFIKDVGEAAKILTDEQRRALLGQNPPMQAQTSQSGSAGPVSSADQSGGMGDM